MLISVTRPDQLFGTLVRWTKDIVMIQRLLRFHHAGLPIRAASRVLLTNSTPDNTVKVQMCHTRVRPQTPSAVTRRFPRRAMSSPQYTRWPEGSPSPAKTKCADVA